MKIKVIDEGVVTKRSAGTPTAVAAGPRLARAGGDVLCSFMVQSALACNDFVPLLARSGDGGRTWRDERPLWPHLRGTWSLFGSIASPSPAAPPAGVSSAPTELTWFGSRCRIDTPGESFWCDATQGLKANELVWSRSTDGGATWSEPTVIPMTIAGAAEAPGPMCVTRAGRRIVCYAPYHTFDPSLRVDRGQLAGLSSDDNGATWSYQPIMRFAEPDSGAAEAWVVELSDGRLLAACWHVDHSGQNRDYPNPYAVSHDGGRTWRGPFSTGILGHTTALTALPDGRAILLYVRRKHGPPGVCLALVSLRGDEMRIEMNEPVWTAGSATQRAGSAEHANWSDYSFGEPAALVLPDGHVLVTLWCVEPDFRGVRWVRVKL